jgi:hypothetical protein
VCIHISAPFCSSCFDFGVPCFLCCHFVHSAVLRQQLALLCVLSHSVFLCRISSLLSSVLDINRICPCLTLPARLMLFHL